MVHYYNNLTEIKNKLEEKREQAKKAESKGMYMEETFINLQSANEKLIRARTLIHTFEYEMFDGVLKESLEILKKEEIEIEKANRELFNR